MNIENAKLSQFLATVPKRAFKNGIIGYMAMANKFTNNDTVLTFIDKLNKTELDIIKKHSKGNELFKRVAF